MFEWSYSPEAWMAVELINIAKREQLALPVQLYRNSPPGGEKRPASTR